MISLSADRSISILKEFIIREKRYWTEEIVTKERTVFKGKYDIAEITGRIYST